VDKALFTNREFSFTLKDDVYIRYRSYANAQEMEDDIKKMNPYKIDIGAIFTDKPKDHKKIKAAEFKPHQRELVFDIDMTDYDEIRTCCSGAAICERCWPFMNVALKIVDQALREDFGFENLLWVYSGRRGIHCWVSDVRARKLTNDGRTAVAHYLNVVAGGDQARKVALKSPMYPFLDRALEICTDYFERWILGDAKDQGQDILRSVESQKKLLAVVGDEQIEQDMLESWAEDNETSVNRWKELCARLAKEAKKQSHKKAFLGLRKSEIIMQYTYPRLDVHVSTQMNHLLKSPFVVHPKTGRVCIPIDPETADDFNPFIVPTITDLLRELDEYTEDEDAMEEGGRVVKNFDRTSLRGPLEIFDKFLSGCASENGEHRKMAKEATERMAAETGDW